MDLHTFSDVDCANAPKNKTATHRIRTQRVREEPHSFEKSVCRNPNPRLPHSQSLVMNGKYCRLSLRLPAKWIFHFLLIRACRSGPYISAACSEEEKSEKAPLVSEAVEDVMKL